MKIALQCLAVFAGEFISRLQL